MIEQTVEQLTPIIGLARRAGRWAPRTRRYTTAAVGRLRADRSRPRPDSKPGEGAVGA